MFIFEDFSQGYTDHLPVRFKHSSDIQQGENRFYLFWNS